MQFLKNEKINRTLYDDFQDTTFPGERDLENSPDFDGKDEYFFEENNPSDTTDQKINNRKIKEPDKEIKFSTQKQIQTKTSI